MKILIVDDEPMSLKRLEYFCNKFGYDVLAADDGASAWTVWQRYHPRIVITDRSMPTMDGLELCTKIRAHEGDNYTYIIILTALSEISEIIEGMKVGADDYITKPFNKDELYLRIKAGERVLKLQDRDIVIFSLAKLAESRDQDTGNHLERVRYFCRLLSETIQRGPDAPAELTSQFIENIFLTSTLHDIGKVGIPDKILLKPGKLDEYEFNIMKTHTIIGHNTLSEALKKNPRAEYLKMSADIALYHHEKFDGTGYPKGLHGHATPLSARIVALADVYDALTTKRVYKEAFSNAETLAIIAQSRGKHFDPMIVDALLAVADDFAQIRNRFQDDDPDAAVKGQDNPLSQEFSY